MFGIYLVYVLLAGGLITTILSAMRNEKTGVTPALITLLISWVITISLLGQSPSLEYGLVFNDYTNFFSIIFLIVASFALISMLEEKKGSIMGLALLSTGAMVALVAANDLLTILVAFKAMAIPLIIGVAMSKEKLSKEAAIKFFVLSILSAALLIYGVALLGSASGSFILSDIAVVAQNAPTAQVLLALVFIFTGLAVEIAIVPFHIWMPDTYQGSYPPLASILAASTKKAGFGVAFKILLIALPFLKFFWSDLFLYFAIITMTFGNLLALRQPNLKRMLAYSSIAHAGYIMMGLAASSEPAIAGSLLQIINHSILTGALFIAAKVGADKGLHVIDDFRGLSKTSIWFAVACTIMMFSLAGIPPLGGFFSKFVLFTEVVRSGLPWLTVIAVINRAISVGYYAKWSGTMFTSGGKSNIKLSSKFSLGIVLIGAALTLILGFVPFANLVLDMCVKAASTLFFI